ncbi:Gldg family protein [Gilvimarinus sp. F26214L]|uniref:Gldg family protein n=1 Tax=Gilvimarinus sp. DZF01 TaxID=3461371 RepID=UPI00404648E3
MPEWSKPIGRVASKEFRGFFSTPAAYLFLGAFLAVTLFVFFWVETFFARNIADLRPMFQWMPLLLIFLVAALTMRSWSEERRAGTMESLFTAPISPLSLVLGKFLGALGLVAVALALTLPLAFTVALLGPLDWGPVIGGYVATLFLAAGYIAIGLFMSVRTDNPIVALILTAVVCGVFYLIGSDTLTNLFGHQIGGLLALLGTGTRFDSITRGVLDLRDIYYYLSMVGVFLTLNLFSLERLRWAGNPRSRNHALWGWLVGLTAANFLAANLWLAPINWARADITEGNLYSLSEATEQQLASLQEPLLIRGYFSAKTHPYLAPIVPQIKDLLEEYAVAADGRARVEFIDPTRDPEAEEEAAAQYGIRPVPFQTADRYQAAVVSSYFDVVIAYGDEFETLSYQDLIEVKSHQEGELDVVLNNPEYAITGAIRKVAGAWRAGGDPFAGLNQTVTFRGYMSPDEKLPESLQELRKQLEELLERYKAAAGDRLQISFQDPDGGDGHLAEQLLDEYGFGPQIAGLLDPDPFWFYMVLESGDDLVQVPLPDVLDKNALERSIDAAIQRLTPGVLNTVALFKPQSFGPHGQQFSQLEQVLGENARIEETDLKNGRVPEEADLLLVLAPSELDEKQRFAIDQFLMRGGNVVMTTSPYSVEVSQTVSANTQDSGLDEWLAHHGIEIEQSMVLDPQNAALPIPVQRNIGGLTLRDYRMVPYPHFPDLRGAGLSEDNPITASLGQLTMNWASPIIVDSEKNSQRSVSELLRSSEDSWTSDSTTVLPDYQRFPATGFAVDGDRGSRVLAVAVEGRFDSYYKGKESPLAAVEPAESNGEDADAEGAAGNAEGDGIVESAADSEAESAITGIIERSPESARLLVIASNAFGSDAAISLASQGLNTLYLQPLAFIQNAVDYALEDQDLLALRGRTQLARTLDPVSEGEQRLWEYLNYALALAGLAVVWGWRRRVAASDRKRYQQILAEV